jgi:putative hemolysin
MEKTRNLLTLSGTYKIRSAEETRRCLGTTPQAELREGRYLARFARSSEEVKAALRLRFEVFNLELGEGLESSFASGQDEDEFDESCQHLLVFERPGERVVGTYRLRIAETAYGAGGFYSAREFDLALFPPGVLENSVELGRACIAQDHRNTQVLFLLWKGIAAYVACNQKRYLFGCCSLTSQDQAEGNRVFHFLQRSGHMHPDFWVCARPGFECSGQDHLTLPCTSGNLPRLFRTYLRFGAKVCGPPAIDRQFKTIDFLVIFDVDAMDGKTHQMFFGA